ncbi:MAG: hypothetical protein VX642_08095 [Bdellovibrionota bacterium]|nr:hypothetical protein [Bdellovibrionota bacterium]
MAKLDKEYLKKYLSQMDKQQLAELAIWAKAVHRILGNSKLSKLTKTKGIFALSTPLVAEKIFRPLFEKGKSKFWDNKNWAHRAGGLSILTAVAGLSTVKLGLATTLGIAGMIASGSLQPIIEDLLAIIGDQKRPS